MKKFFNTTGPCNERLHYMVPALQRNTQIEGLVEQGQYFVLHSARQTGKTTVVKAYVNDLNAKGEYYALYCSLESAHVLGNPYQGIPEIMQLIRLAIKYSQLPFKQEFAKDIVSTSISTQINEAFKDYCSILDKPLVVFFDEVDGLKDGTMITFLRQLRDGYVNRPEMPFIHSVALVGMKNIRDYKSSLRDGHETLGSASPFNIITDALVLRNFTLSEIKALYLQHTLATGQLFEDDVFNLIYQQTDGQPWLVNAIGRELVSNNSVPITVPLVDKAIYNIILRRDTHVDSLLDKLKDERVRKVIEPILTGEKDRVFRASDDVEYCLDLGLIKDVDGELKPANKIYNELIVRALSFDSQYSMKSLVANVWINKEGLIDMNGLLKAFQVFWRENSEIWVSNYQYKEAAPHLILQAFLQRIVNGGGRIAREYAVNRKRLDLCLVYAERKYVMELKIRYGEATIKEGLIQIGDYLDAMGESIGWLIVFDRNADKPWDERIFWNTVSENGKTVHIVGC